MSKASVKKQTKKEIEKGSNSSINFLLSPIGISYDIVKYIIVSIIISTLIEWVGMGLGYFDAHHAKNILNIEIAYLGNNFPTTLFNISAQELTSSVLGYLNEYLGFLKTENERSVSSAQMLSAKSINSIGQIVGPYLNSAYYIIMITAVRCVIIALSIGLLVIVGIAAIVDGLHERELRIVGGDVEHGDVYHWAKRLVTKVIIISPIIYLAWPGAINPNFIFLPGLAIFFMAVFLVFSKYKKVL